MGLESFIANFHSTGEPIRRPFIIAEAGVNHEGSMELAKRLINQAKEGGADAIAIAHILHYKEISLEKIRRFLAGRGMEVTVHDDAAYM